MRRKGNYFLTSCVNNFSGKWGRGEGRQVKLTSDGNFPPLDRNQIFLVALVYCDKMSTIAFLGIKKEEKNIFTLAGVV